MEGDSGFTFPRGAAGAVESARVRALIDWLAARQREAWERSSDEHRAMRNKEKAA